MAGLTIGGVDFHRSDRRILFDIYRGFFGKEGVQYEGEDDDVQDATGMEAQPYRPVSRTIEFRGWVQGNGATLAERREDMLAAFDAIYAVLDPSLDPVTVVVTGPYLGVPVGQTRTLTAKYVGDSWGDPDPDWARRVGVFTMTCLDSPPDWVVSGP